MDLLLQLKDLQFTSPIFLMLGALLAILLIAVKLHRMARQKKGNIGLAELNDLYKEQIWRAKIAGRLRVFLLALAIAGAGLITAGPYSENSGEVARTRTIEHVRTVMIALDTSGSMKSRNPSGEGTIFEMSRNQAIDFLESQDNIRAGFIFYSEWPIVWRRPTIETKVLAKELANMNVSYPKGQTYGLLGAPQLPVFSSGTHTPRALYAAGNIFRDLYIEEGLKDGAVILLTDLQDRLDEVEESINALTKNGISVYILANSRNQKTIDEFKQRMAKNPIVWVFNARLESDMADAYERISELESSLMEIEEIVPSEKYSLRAQAALIVFIFLFTFAITGEVFFRRARGGG
ncbi:MAG: hypothetical protein A2919_00815 [Candidatus Spechtbacteria bacterium RIFCSPLOWO2_01_FULL_43_12]|uniref:VWFA domain-containing protein n=1 Tax=Candidatus Spechtbacteria bacterium RIFCSPLOWO2_01_FULL_43_12 TaxID=1802162 RepID=A0A1G2HEX7_9BACT|nr:MAG: hypothetical protein A2919_00815 [Candidatus Spechtbacteria bacterium RIFCSPLOWO2_01_FULL_43_12]